MVTTRGQSGIPLSRVYSNDKELNQSDGLWQWLGESLALNKADKLLIRDANMEAALNNLKQNPGISGWIGAIRMCLSQ